MKPIIIIQARENSKRLDKKILKKVLNKTLLEIMYGRIKHLQKKFKIIFAIPKNNSKLKNEILKFQGNIFEEKDIEKLEEGLTKEQVQFIFGTSLIKDPFHSSRWDYYYSIRVGNELLDESKLSIFFNEMGLVDSWIIENIKEVD